jgi:drug/metabolite transporter (DMT)-like permease
MQTERYTQSEHMKGIICIILAAFFFSLMSVFVKLSGDVPTMQKSLFRNLIAAVIAFVTLAGTPEKFSIRRDCISGLLLRSLFGTIGILCNFWAIDHMIISDANMLNKLSPFFAIIMSCFILKEFPAKREWLLVAAAFAGALFVIKPTAGVASFPALVGALGGFAAGTAYTFVRKISTQGERGPVIVMFFSAFSCLSVLPFVLADFRPMTLFQTLMLLGAGVSAAGGQMSVTAAYRHAPAREISIFDYSQILWAALFGFLLFGTVPDLFSVIGYVIIITAAVIRWHWSRRAG